MYEEIYRIADKIFKKVPRKGVVSQKSLLPNKDPALDAFLIIFLSCFFKTPTGGTSVADILYPKVWIMLFISICCSWTGSSYSLVFLSYLLFCILWQIFTFSIPIWVWQLDLKKRMFPNFQRKQLLVSEITSQTISYSEWTVFRLSWLIKLSCLAYQTQASVVYHLVVPAHFGPTSF